ncbi:MAG: hypothetical protein IVW53_14635 [Chloroflexi bacterium]|nr:hypothetical protein [Chloroflexota bacterium]
MESSPPTRTPRPPTLRPYQLAPIKAIIESIRTRAGRTFVVEIARQGGKNEMQSRLEALLLTAHRHNGGAIVKTAPTLEPQLRTSFHRLADYLTADGIPHHSAWPQLSVGRALIDMRSAEPSANVAGATASLLLEVDEAQDVTTDTYQRRFRPMASTTNATTLLCGTAWQDDDLLQTTIAANRDAEHTDGIRRNFLYNAREVSLYNEQYAAFVAGERARLGPDHPLVTTEYDLIPLAGEGRLFTGAQLAQLQGPHTALTSPVIGDRYIAGLDLGGEDTGATRRNDRTVLTIARLAAPDAAQRAAGITPAEVVHHHATRGQKHAEAIPQLAAIAQLWNIGALTVDATGIGEATAGMLRASLPRCAIEAFKFTQASKSALAFELIAAVNTGAIRLYASDASNEWRTCKHELEQARKETRPNKTLNMYVPENIGNDDYLISLALTAHTAAINPPRRAIGH